MNKEDFLADVMHEINSLKKMGTAAELKRLDFSSFSSRSETRCIYGQMTGNCESGRAKVLMDAGCTRVFELNSGVNELGGKTYGQAKKKINGENTGQGWYKSWGDKYYRAYAYLSALEGYICLKGAKTEQIIAYLKGERKTLKL